MPGPENNESSSEVLSLLQIGQEKISSAQDVLKATLTRVTGLVINSFKQFLTNVQDNFPKLDWKISALQEGRGSIQWSVALPITLGVLCLFLYAAGAVGYIKGHSGGVGTTPTPSSIQAPTLQPTAIPTPAPTPPAIEQASVEQPTKLPERPTEISVTVKAGSSVEIWRTDSDNRIGFLTLNNTTNLIGVIQYAGGLGFIELPIESLPGLGTFDRDDLLEIYPYGVVRVLVYTYDSLYQGLELQQ